MRDCACSDNATTLTSPERNRPVVGPRPQLSIQDQFVELADDTRVVLLAAGLIFLWALLLGVWKYRGMAASLEGLAHPYVDVAHRAALLYSFATLLIAAFVGYVIHGLRRDTDNQFRDPVRGTHSFMSILIVAEIGGFSVLPAGFVEAQIL